jgi:hypothetical protein
MTINYDIKQEWQAFTDTLSVNDIDEVLAGIDFTAVCIGFYLAKGMSVADALDVSMESTTWTLNGVLPGGGDV